MGRTHPHRQHPAPMRPLAALLASALPLLPNGGAQLLPAGEFAARDGRPGAGKTWKVGDAAGAALAARLNDVAKRTPISIDYEHQTLLAKDNGQPAPAAGWITRVDWRPGEGLFAEVNWTERARAHIQANEYRYISPVILYADDGTVVGLHNAALVSVPAIVGMEPVVAALAALAAPLPTAKGSCMDRKLITTALGLAEDASDAQITERIAALAALEKRPAVPQAMAAALGLADGADEAAALAALTKLQKPDAGTLAQVGTLQQQVAALSAQILERDVLELVDGAIDARKLLPAQRDWALATGRKDLAALQAFVAATPEIPGLAGQSGGKERGGNAEAEPAEVARKALAWQTAQLAAGVTVSTAQAVDAVLSGAAK